MEKILHQLFESSSLVALITDESFRIRFVSSGVEALFGVPSIRLLGQNAFDFVNPDQRVEWQRCLAEANNNKSGEITLTTPSGREYHLDVIVTNLTQHEQVHGVVIMLHDNTHRTNAQQALAKANEHLGEFIFKVTHDLRAPLNSVVGLIGLAETASREDSEKYLRLARMSLQKMDSLITELSHWHEVEKMAILSREINVRELLEQEITLLANQPEAQDINIVLNVNSAVPLKSDPIRLQAIITNILSNSIKYMDRTRQNKEIVVDVSVQLKHCVIVIRDNGIGMDPVHLPMIFNKYYRVNSDSKGTGLGLHIVKDTLERLGGTVHVDSAPGRGTQFTIRVPNFLEQLKSA